MGPLRHKTCCFIKGMRVLPCILGFLLLSWSSLQAQERTLWDNLSEPAQPASSWLRTEDIQLIGRLYRPLIGAEQSQALVAAVGFQNSQSIQQILREASLSSFSDFVSRRGSLRFSAQELAMLLVIYRLSQNHSPFYLLNSQGQAQRPDNLGYFHQARMILEASPYLDRASFDRLHLSGERGILLGLSQNPQVRRTLPAPNRYTMSQYVTELRSLAEGSEFEALQLALMASLVNSHSTERLNQLQMRSESPVRDLSFEPKLADAIFQMLGWNESQLRNFVLRAEIPDGFVYPKESKSFQKLHDSLQAQATAQSMSRLAERCRR